MTEIQQKLYDMLSWFHGFCVKHGLRYYMLGGTLLGSVRHKGFIPWDDDIDVGMPRSDYDRLAAIMERENGRYVLEQPLTNKDFVYPFCKLYDTATTLVENTRYKTKRGLFLDVFALDGVGNTLTEAQKYFKALNKKLKLILCKVCAIDGHRKFYKNAAIILGRCLPYGWRAKTAAFIRKCAERDFDADKYVANISGNWGEREIAEREWFGEPTLYEFENNKFFGPKDADKYLTHVYGEYMKLPPSDKQVSHHDFLEIDLCASYLDS